VPQSGDEAPARDVSEATLGREGGNVARTARALGVHRTQLRRWIVRHGIDPKRFAR
jgi:transposase-like protein